MLHCNMNLPLRSIDFNSLLAKKIPIVKCVVYLHIRLTKVDTSAFPMVSFMVQALD